VTQVKRVPEVFGQRVTQVEDGNDRIKILDRDINAKIASRALSSKYVCT
jgi:hypothetical protein